MIFITSNDRRPADVSLGDHDQIASIEGNHDRQHAGQFVHGFAGRLSLDETNTVALAGDDQVSAVRLAAGMIPFRSACPDVLQVPANRPSLDAGLMVLPGSPHSSERLEREDR
jgi:hypothetical protein